MSYETVDVFCISAFFLPAKGQVLDFTNLKDSLLANGIHLLLQQDTLTDNVYIGFYIKYRPLRSNANRGADLMFAQMTGAQIIGRDIYKRFVVTDSIGVDSSFRFLNYVIFRRKFNEFEFLRAKHFLKTKDIYSRAAYILTLGRRHYLSRELSDFVTLDTIYNFRNRLKNSQIAVVIYGNFDETKVIKLFNKRFKNFQVKPVTLAYSGYPKTKFSVNFVDTKIPAVGFAFATRYNFAYNFLLYNVLRAYLQIRYNKISISVPISDNLTVFSAFVRDSNLLATFYGLHKALLAFQQAKLTDYEINLIKQELGQEFDLMLHTPQFYIDLVYFTWLLDLPRNFALKYLESIQTFNKQTLYSLKVPGFADSSAYILMGNKTIYYCDLLRLSKNYKIYLLDSNIYRYDVIPRGFDADVLISRYLRFVAPKRVPKNLTINFRGFYFVDSTFFKVFGKILQKGPNYYKFELDLALPDDTLLLLRTVRNGTQWFAMTDTGETAVDSLNFYATNFFVEKYYKKLGYKTELECDPILIASGIYKVAVWTGHGKFYDYYDNGQKIKLRTACVPPDSIARCDVYYYDYQRVKIGNQDFKLPKIIHQQASRYTLELHITDISTRHIKRKEFTMPDKH